MRILGWIRVGDKAACGGTVAEGFERASYNGIPYSFKGAKMSCPQSCVITEAANILRLANGQRVPYHGHRTSGGCPLNSTLNNRCGYADAALKTDPAQYVPDGRGGWASCKHDSPYDLSFVVSDERTGHPMSDVPYRLILDDGRAIEGRTDATGRTTTTVWSDHPEHATLTVPYYGDVSKTADSDMGPDACDC